jgi:hypothetical protein
MAHFGFDQAIFRTGYQYPTLHLHEVGKLCGVDLAHTHRVAFLAVRGKKLAEVSEEREV